MKKSVEEYFAKHGDTATGMNRSGMTCFRRVFGACLTHPASTVLQ